MTAASSINEILERREFEALLPQDWALILESMIREDEQEAAMHTRTRLPLYIRTLPNLKLSRYFLPVDRDSTSFSVMLSFLKDEASLKTRENMCFGVENLIVKYLEKFTSAEPGAGELLMHVIFFEAYFEGVISGPLAEEIALNRALPVSVRQFVVVNLPQRPFRMSVSHQCWQLLREEVPQTPQFAGAVIEYLVLSDELEEALRVPLSFHPGDDDSVLTDLALSLTELFNQMDLGVYRPQETLSGYPPWALKLLREEVFPQIAGKELELKALLP